MVQVTPKLGQIAFAVFLIGGIGLTSCTSAASTREAPSDHSASTSIAETSTPTSTVAATERSTAATTTEATHVATHSLLPDMNGTDAPTFTLTAPSASVPCGTPPAVEVTTLDLSALSWEAVEIDDQRVHQLLVPTFLPFPINISPNNRWLVTAFQNIGGEAAVALIDTQADAHWWVNERAYQAANSETLFQQWLPNGELVWLEETTHLLVGNEQNHQAWKLQHKCVT